MIRDLVNFLSLRMALARYRRAFRLKNLTLERFLEGSCGLHLDLSCWQKDLRAGGFFDAAVFAALVNARSPKCYLEIGTGFGRTATLAALNTAPEASINTICIDYQDNPNIGWIFREHPLRGKINAMKGDSMTFNFQSWFGKVDFIFVDGAHDFEHVRNDTSVAFKLIAPGGWIVWHDLSFECPGVAQALQSCEHADEIVQIDGTVFGCFRDARQ